VKLCSSGSPSARIKVLYSLSGIYFHRPCRPPNPQKGSLWAVVCPTSHEDWQIALLGILTPSIQYKLCATPYRHPEWLWGECLAGFTTIWGETTSRLRSIPSTPPLTYLKPPPGAVFDHYYSITPIYHWGLLFACLWVLVSVELSR